MSIRILILMMLGLFSLCSLADQEADCNKILKFDTSRRSGLMKEKTALAPMPSSSEVIPLERKASPTTDFHLLQSISHLSEQEVYDLTRQGISKILESSQSLLHATRILINARSRTDQFGDLGESVAQITELRDLIVNSYVPILAHPEILMLGTEVEIKEIPSFHMNLNLFLALANDSRFREILASQGYEIPELSAYQKRLLTQFGASGEEISAQQVNEEFEYPWLRRPTPESWSESWTAFTQAMVLLQEHVTRIASRIELNEESFLKSLSRDSERLRQGSALDRIKAILEATQPLMDQEARRALALPPSNVHRRGIARMFGLLIEQLESEEFKRVLDKEDVIDSVSWYRKFYWHSRFENRDQFLKKLRATQNQLLGEVKPSARG